MSGLSEVGFGVDSFGKPKILSEKESLLQIVFNVFVAKPGNYPSMPEIGIDIGSRILYLTEDRMEIEQLQIDIRDQLIMVIPGEKIGDVIVGVRTINGEVVVVIKVPIVDDSGVNSSDEVVAGFSMSEKDRELMHTIGFLSDSQNKT